MSSLLPKLEDTLVDLLQYGDSGLLVVSGEAARWDFYVQGGVLVGLARRPAPDDPAQSAEDPSSFAATLLREAMQAQNALWDFQEGVGPEDFGLFDARLALVEAVACARDFSDLLERVRPVLDGWPELKVDPDTLTPDRALQRWLVTLDGLAPGSERLTHAPGDAGHCLAAVWVAWKLGDLDLHTAALVDDAQESWPPEDESDEPTGPAEEIAPGADGPPGELGDLDHDPHEEVVHDEATFTHRTAPTTTGGRTGREDRSSAAVPSHPDPFVQGVALARAGEVSQALPLLQAAFEDDPERPGLEEWLGYTLFAACRDSDPAKARHGLSMLREVMYRTSPTGETPVLPWLLMARAQFERGDLLQARSILGNVLAREPDDPEAMHLDERIKAAEALVEQARHKPPTVSIARIIRMTSLFAVLTGIVMVVQVVERYQPPRTDYAPQFAAIAPLRELHRVHGGWVGVTPAGTEPDSSPQAALQACHALADATHMHPSETMTLVSERGMILAECGERLE
ncbi:hypothetical protein L6R53_31670 [Myxococcota bacterium]|nr:hypothetical protein [Myxococcota bacterium]